MQLTAMRVLNVSESTIWFAAIRCNLLFGILQNLSVAARH